MTNNKITVYLNHRASSVEKVLWKKEITNQLFRSEVIFRTPKDLEHLKNLVLTDLNERVSSIISIGGDGTVHTLIQYLALTGTSLLTLPAGTANDLANELGHHEIRKSVWCIRLNQCKTIDLVRINDRYMATNGGIGLAGNVALEINKIRKRYPIFKKIMKNMGKSVYSLFLGKEWLLKSNLEMKLYIESKEFVGEVTTSLFTINNQPIIAGSFKVAPHTRNDDGTFNVTIFKHPNRFKLMKAIIKMSKGQYPKDDPYLISFETSKVKIENLDKQSDLQFFGDGELFRKAQTYEIEMVPRALKVYQREGDGAAAGIGLDGEDLL